MNNLPQTSHEANKAATLEMRQRHWDKIKEALMVLKLATGGQIAQEAKMDYHAVMRRLSEMERNEMVYKPGGKIPTSTNRLAYQYAIRGSETVVPTPEKFNPTDTTLVDFASMVIAKTKQGKLVQKNLFEN